MQHQSRRNSWLGIPEPDRHSISCPGPASRHRPWAWNKAVHHTSRTVGNASSQDAQTVGANWHPINQPLLWQGSEEEAMRKDAPPQKLQPPWKVILLSDGSVTRHLKLMTGLDVKVECLEMQELDTNIEELPLGAEEIPGPLLRRQVFLTKPVSCNGTEGSAEILVYAASWWNAKLAKKYLANKEQPIWVSLLGAELRREIQQVYHGNSAFLEERLGVKGPFWGRQYVFYWDGGKPLTAIYEVFSPTLEQYLGPLGG